MKNICYQFRTIGTSIPYYHYVDTGETKWGYDPQYKIFEPNEGMYHPPPKIQDFCGEGRNIFASTTIFRPKTIINLNVDKKKDDNDTKIYPFLFEKGGQVPLSFMKVPFFPSDLFLLMDCQTLFNYLKQSMNLNNFYEKGVKKGKKLEIDDIFLPGPKTLRGPILKSTKLSNLAVNLAKSCRGFIYKSEHSDYSRIFSIFRILDGNLSLLSEIVVFLIIETNSKDLTNNIKIAWRLLLIIISKYNLHEESVESFNIVRVLRSYVTIVASTPNISHEIVNYAMLCLFRLSCIRNTINIQYSSDNPQEYFSQCQTSRQLFGVSLAEIIYKERFFNRAHKNLAKIQQSSGRSMINLLAQPTTSSNLTLTAHRDLSTISLRTTNFNDSITNTGSSNFQLSNTFNQSLNFNISSSSFYNTYNNFNDNGTLSIELEDKDEEILYVPKILLNLIDKLKEANAFHTQNIFLTKCPSKSEKLRAIYFLNVTGKLDSNINDVYIIASILKYFLKNLQEPLIPLKVVKEKLDPQLEWFKCIQIANLLPNENKDTLMYLIGFLQELVTFKEFTFMDGNKLSKSFAKCVTRDVTNTEDLKTNSRLIDSTSRFLYCLIENWKTSDVYSE